MFYDTNVTRTIENGGLTEDVRSLENDGLYYDTNGIRTIENGGLTQDARTIQNGGLTAI
jgi:hypothetical protein